MFVGSAGATFLSSAGAECFFAPQEQNVSLLRRSRMFLCSAGAECFFAPQEQRFFAPQEQRVLAPQEQRVFAPQEQNVSLLRRSNVSLLRRSNVSLLRRSRMFIAACALTRHSGGVRCGDHCLDHRDRKSTRLNSS